MNQWLWYTRPIGEGRHNFVPGETERRAVGLFRTLITARLHRY
ncbi:MAG: hypothetical protein AAF633_11675 [Chloroflexota bacterium]